MRMGETGDHSPSPARLEERGRTLRTLLERLFLPFGATSVSIARLQDASGDLRLIASYRGTLNGRACAGTTIVLVGRKADLQRRAHEWESLMVTMGGDAEKHVELAGVGQPVEVRWLPHLPPPFLQFWSVTAVAHKVRNASRPRCAQSGDLCAVGAVVRGGIWERPEFAGSAFALSVDTFAAKYALMLSDDPKRCVRHRELATASLSSIMSDLQEAHPTWNLSNIAELTELTTSSFRTYDAVYHRLDRVTLAHERCARSTATCHYTRYLLNLAADYGVVYAHVIGGWIGAV